MAKAFSPVKQLQNLWFCHVMAKTGCREALEGFVGDTGAAELKAGGAGLVRVALCMPVWWWRCHSVNVDFFGAKILSRPAHHTVIAQYHLCLVIK